MKNKFIFGFALFLLLTTFISQKEFSINKFKIKEIKVENNEIIKEEELIKDLSFLYNKNIFFLNSFEIKKKLDKKNFIKRLEIKKTYPDKLLIKIFEKEPIAIIINKQGKFFLGKKIELIKFRKIMKYDELPIIYGDIKNFKILFTNLKKINFPFKIIKKFVFFKVNRWDIELEDERLIRLPSKRYNKSLKNFIQIKNNRNFDKYKIFDYRLEDQLILK